MGLDTLDMEIRVFFSIIQYQMFYNFMIYFQPK